jgi:hypothetical protein
MHTANPASPQQLRRGARNLPNFHSLCWLCGCARTLRGSKDFDAAAARKRDGG